LCSLPILARMAGLCKASPATAQRSNPSPLEGEGVAAPAVGHPALRATFSREGRRGAPAGREAGARKSIIFASPPCQGTQFLLVVEPLDRELNSRQCLGCAQLYCFSMVEQDSQPDPPPAMAGQDTRERDLIAVVAGLVRELHPQRMRSIDIAPLSRIERDLGIDSLGRTDLILRIERAFRVRLPAQTIGEAETVHDLVQALERAGPKLERVALEASSTFGLPSVPAAGQARTLIEVLEWHAANHPGRLHLTVLQDDAAVLGTLTYGELATKARNVARGLIAPDVAPGDPVALMPPTSIHFFIALFGLLYPC